MLKVQEIRELIKLIDESSIDEFSYESNGTKVNMKKQKTDSSPAEKTVIQRTEPAQPEPIQPVGGKSEKQEKPADNLKQEEPANQEVNYDHEIVSPMVGTFYSSPNPESDPFVSKGENVEEDTVVCIVEAMKLFNEIEAETKGEIVDVLVENGELVEFGQPLFRVKSE